MIRAAGLTLALLLSACGGDAPLGDDLGPRRTDGGGADAPDADLDAGPPGVDASTPGARVEPAPTFDSDIFRQAAAIALLPDGRVWLAGGVIVRRSDETMMSGTTGREEAEVLDPVTATYELVEPLELGRWAPSTIVLPDGRILVSGGIGGPAGEFGQPRSTAELVDGETFETTLLASEMSEARRGHFSVLIGAGADAGKVAVIGGGEATVTVDVFDPATDTFSPMAITGAPEGSAGFVELADGRVLLFGVVGEGEVRDRCFVFDPATGAFTPTGSMAQSRDSATGTLLPSGDVLVAGGFVTASNPPLANAEVWRPATGEWTATTGDLNVGRRTHGAALLGSGRVAIAGGNDTGQSATDNVEIYDPATRTFTLLESVLTNPRTFPQAVSLPDGRAMFVGGQLIIPPRNSMIVSTVDFVAE